MEYDNNSEISSPRLEWEILDLYGGNENDLGMISSKTSAESSFHCPDKVDTASGFRPYIGGISPACCDDFVGAVNSSSLPGRDHHMMINLRLGGSRSGESLSPNKNCDKSAYPSFSEGSSSTPSKRSRASYQNMQNPSCQVEGCNLDLKSAKDYHRRHRICEAHSKSPRVVVGGLVRRFCQQCSRFHDLSEFDDKKRSCRKRLSDHNARRRRLPPEPLHHHLSSSSALYDQRSHNNILLNGLTTSSLSPSSEWRENARTSSLVGPTSLNVGSSGLDEIVPRSMGSGERLCPFQASRNTRAAPPYQSLHLTARSLLSSNSWSDNSNVIGLDQALMHGEEGSSSAATHMQEHGSCSFLFQPKGFF